MFERALAGLAALVLLAGAARAEETPAMREVLAQAKAEGQVSVFVGSPKFTRAAEDALSKAFAAQYGFPLKITLASLGPHPGVVAKVVAETKAGLPASTDYFPSGEAMLDLLHQGGAVATVDWAALGVPASMISTETDGVRVRVNPRNVIYNTNLVSRAEAPHSYEDLLDPKWKGRIVAPAFASAFDGLPVVMGEDKAMAFVTRLVKEQNVTFVQTFSDLPTKVASGEFPIAFGINANISGLMDKGAPIANAPLDKAWGSGNYGVVLKAAPHPNAAKAFAVFACCTKAGQAALYKATFMANFDTPDTELFEIGGDGRGVTPSYDYATKDEPRINKAMSAILGF